MIDEVVDDAVNAILEEEDATGAEKVVMELKELEEKVVGAAVATLKEEGGGNGPLQHRFYTLLAIN